MAGYEVSLFGQKLNQLSQQVNAEAGHYFLEQNQYRMWSDLNDRILMLATLLLEIGEDSSGSSSSDVLIENAKQIGLSLAIYECFEKQNNMAIRTPVENQVDAFTNYRAFYYCPVRLKIGDLSLWDIRTKEFLPVESVYRYFSRAYRASRNPAYLDQLAEESDDSLRQIYPEVARLTTHMAVNHALTACLLDSESRETLVGKLSNAADMAALGNFQVVADWMEVYRLKISNALMDPDDSNFEAIKKEVERDLREIDTSPSFWGFLISNYLLDVVLSYRRFKKLRDEGVHQDFYERLTSELKRNLNSRDVLTEDDVPLFLINEEYENEGPSLEKIGKVVGEIFSKTSQRLWEFSSEEIDWANLAAAQSVSVTFDRDRPQKFLLDFNYQNDQGEKQTIHVFIDAKKGKESLDWFLAEDPSDPSMQVMRRSLQAQVGLILQKILERANQEYLQRKLGEKPATPKIMVRERKDSHVPSTGRKVGRRSGGVFQRALGMPVHEVLEEVSEILEKPRVKMIIKIPEDDGLEKFMDKLSVADKRIVREAIERFNELSVGDFGRIKSAEVKLYRLRVNTTVRGGVRVLLQEVSGGDGTHLFEIIDIDNRARIYKRHGIE